jgi:hypothetical protein
MKVKKNFVIGLLFVAVVMAGLVMRGPLNAAGTDERPLKEACIKATVRAIGMEIKSYEQKLDAAQNGSGDASNIPVFKKRIVELKDELEKYRAMDPESYIIPEKMSVAVSVSRTYQEGSILELEEMTKSGPFYHLAGIRGDDYNVLKNGQKYTMTVYLVYKRDYVFPFAANYYVYAGDFAVSYALSPRQTGEEILEELVIKPNTITIGVGSNGCTDKNSFRVDVKKEDGITKKAPHYVLTFYRVKPDECKAIVDEGVLVTFDLEKDCGLSGVYTFSVANRVYSKP